MSVSQTPVRPLREGGMISDPDLALAARLLVHTSPVAKSEARKRRVWNALSEGEPSRWGSRLTGFRVAVAFATVMVAAVSSAAAGHYYVTSHASSNGVLESARPAQAKPAAPAKARPRVKAPEPTLPRPIAAEELPTDTSETPDRTAARVSTLKPRGDARKAPVDPQQAELLVEAMRARSAGNPERVSQLVDEYRQKHPQGALQEEALILSIDAAVARHSPSARGLAREYLRRFPQGRFAAQARRAASGQ